MNRKSTLTIIFLILIFVACSSKKDQKVHLPSKEYHFIKMDNSKLSTKKSVYVPVYSHIYWQNGESALDLTTTLSVRNISYTDSLYLTDVIYYGSQGEVLKRYIDSTLLLKPMSSYEFIVEHSESRGGAGANFVVKWGAEGNKTAPLIQSVMLETSRGISFVTTGVEMQGQ